MDMTGHQRIPASREVVWKALNDTAILEACIPGCQELIKLSDTQMTATALIKVGPVTAKFQGAVTLSDLDPPNGYRIAGEGQGGVAGFAKGSAVVRLEEDGQDTILHYEVSAQVGGKLSQLGGRLIDATAKQMSGLFFKRFAEEIENQYGDGAGEADNQAGVPQAQHRGRSASTAGAPSEQTARRAAQAPMDVTPGIFRYARAAGIVLLVAAVGACLYLFGGAAPKLESSGNVQVSSDLIVGTLLAIVAAIGYMFGRQQSHAIHINSNLADRIAKVSSEQRE